MASLPESKPAPPMAKHHDDIDSDATDSGDEGPLDPTKEDGWEDVEPEEEEQSIVSLFSDKIFPDVQSMLYDCRENFNFDLSKVQKTLELDFLGTIKLVNYIRSEVKGGNRQPDVSSASLFQDEKYLKPFLEDDALLYNLDELTGEQEDGEPDSAVQVQNLEAELHQMREEFAEYKLMVQRAMNKSLKAEGGDDVPSGTPAASTSAGDAPTGTVHERAENDYFSSYSFNEIHETMIKDTVRTDAYRDFIYDNKNLFKDKVVLDVGCGTGILSMFCAKAGAKRVIAVDNSNIITKAREIIHENGFSDVIQCLRGKIEEVVLPVKQVDIIVSEWMGYCLLFEAMLDSVIWARDRYLVPGGLMVPSHATLRIAPFADSDFVQSHVSFWKNVYGFKMSPMLKTVENDALVRVIEPSTIVGNATTFLYLPLHTITTKELIFTKNFTLSLTEDISSLDGWAVWFDMFFLTSSDKELDNEATPESVKNQGIAAFTTGPDGPSTHWQQAVFLINQGQNLTALKRGQPISGQVEYKKKGDKSRCLDIGISWDIPGAKSIQHQEWSLQ